MKISYIDKNKTIYNQQTAANSAVTVTDGGKRYDVGKLIALVMQAKCGTTQACYLCDEHVVSTARPKRDGCEKCLVGRLIEAVREVEK
jgi:hypothetical protein